jgi:hypothetical protein
MKKLTNIRWNQELKLPSIETGDSYIEDYCFPILFNYNGYEINANVSFGLVVDTFVFDGSTDHYGDSECREVAEVVDVDFELKEIFYNDGDEFKVSLREFNEIQECLKKDLEIQY